jgi:hypothetical protein
MSNKRGELILELDLKKLIILSVIGVSVVATVGTYIVALLAFDSPSQDFRFKGGVDAIMNVYYYHSTSFSAGDTVRITGIMLGAERYFSIPSYYYYFVGETSIRWIVGVLDPNNMPVHFETGTLDNVGIGDDNLPVISFDLPLSAVSGSYKIRVMAWSDFLPSGDTVTFEVLEDTFDVS